MTFTLTPEQLEIRDAVARLCARFGDDYWLKHDTEGGFPHEFHRAMAEGGWLGVAMPEAYGGAGLGITEAAIVMQAVAQSGAGFSGASAVRLRLWNSVESVSLMWMSPVTYSLCFNLVSM